MSKQLSSVAVTEFDSMVKHAYQGMGLLKGSVTVRNNVVGDTYKFRRQGKGLANQKSTSDLVTPMDVSHEFKTATLANWNAPEYTDIFDQADVNFDEKQELAMTIAGALGRRCDQLIIDAMDASTPLTTTVPAGGANLTMAKVIQAQVELRDQGVPNTDLFAVIEAEGLGGLLNDELATSTDYQNIKALVSGEINTLVGFRFNIIETRTEGGLN
jgi:Tfp pilus assembly protein PilV